MSREVKASFGLGVPQRSFLCDWWREHFFVDQSQSQVNAMGQIDFQNGNRRAPDRSSAFKKRAVPQKMLPPSVAAWMEKRTMRSVRGSRPAMFGPLWLLQGKQASASFAAVVSPRCLRARMWSI